MKHVTHQWPKTLTIIMCYRHRFLLISLLEDALIQVSLPTRYIYLFIYLFYIMTDLSTLRWKAIIGSRVI